MAVPQGHVSQSLQPGFFQPCYLYENDGGGQPLQLLDSSFLEALCNRSQSREMFEATGSSMNQLLDYSLSNTQPFFSEPSNSTGSSGFKLSALSSQHEEPPSVLSFSSASNYSHSASMLCFKQEPQNDNLKLTDGEDSRWLDTFFGNLQLLHQLSPRGSTNSCSLAPEINCTKSTGNHVVVTGAGKEFQAEEELEWLYSEEKGDDEIQRSGAPDGGACKRLLTFVDASSCEKGCSAANKKQKTKAVTSKDTQSVAAKNRRERISEKLKILQGLVPNGTKVDLVTMLEKAISYVKFLQLQVKVLSTDEFWPADGGKAPKVAEVKEAIDAILSSHSDRSFASV